MTDTNKDTSVTMITDANIDYFLPLLPRRAKKNEVMAGVIYNNSPAGALLAKIERETMTILSLFVLQELRNNGLGSILLKKADEIAKIANVNMLLIYGPDDEMLVDCLLSCGYSIAQIDKYQSISASKILSSKTAMEKIRGFLKSTSTKHVISFDALEKKYPTETKKKYISFLQKKGFETKDLETSNFDKELSYVVMTGGFISGSLLISKTVSEKELVVRSLFSIGDTMDIVALFAGFAKNIFPLIGEKGIISFVSLDNRTELFLEKVFGKNMLISRNAIHAGKLV